MFTDIKDTLYKIPDRTISPNRGSSNLFLVLENDFKNHQKLLDNILHSIKLSANTEFDIIIYSLNSQIQLPKNLISQDVRIISFGVSFQDAGFQFLYAKNEIVRLGLSTFLCTDTLDQLSSDNALKKSLWGSLKLIKWK